jgi:hypothetical protein
MKGPATQRERVELARPDAATALANLFDPAWSFAGKHVFHDELILSLVRVALQDYRLRYPSCRASQPWLFYDGNPKTTKIRGTPERVDVYCLFCRVLLVHPAIWDYDYTHQLREHTTPCALRSLAGLMEPGAPGTYRLPDAVP